VSERLRGAARLSTEPPDSRASLDDWLRWQEALHPQAIALGLERVQRVAGRLGLPAPGPRTLTVAGTNGKGSSAALLTEIYRAAGYRVGTYSSPHLLRYNERVAIAGRPLSDAALVEGFQAVEAARDGVPLTYFEFGTLAALWLFRAAGVEVQVLEVGMGGRLDAVNLVDADGALITNIGLDHVEFLGRDRERIGFEKAGILRGGRVAVCVDPEPPASIDRQAAAVGASLWHLGRDYRWQPAADAWNWHGPASRHKKLPPPALAGAIQYRNAAGVIALVTRLQPLLPVPQTALRAGLVRVRLPGRFERRGRVILDVAHNVEAARVLADNLAQVGARGLHLVVGMLADKPVEGFVQALAPRARRFYFGGLPPPRGLAGPVLRQRAAAAAPDAVVRDSVVEAYQVARAECAEGEMVVACGSFLTVAAVASVLHG
jgi:dihydrofolate synthase/folylpolyglutamate synthase